MRCVRVEHDKKEKKKQIFACFPPINLPRSRISISVLVVVSPPLFLSTLLPFAQKTKRSCDSSGHEKKPVAHPFPLALPLSLDVDHARRRRVPRCCRLRRLGAVLLVAAIRLARAQTASSRVPSGWPAAAADSSAARACASSHIGKPGLVL